MSVESIESLLDALDQVDGMTDEQLADMMCHAMKVLYSNLTLDQFVDQVLRPFVLQDPESMRSWIDTWRDTLLKQFRQALKARRRRAKITRK